MLALLTIAGAVQAAPSAERKRKAAYLSRFAAFVDWPEAAFARPDSRLVIGIAGDDELAALAERAAAGRKVGGHALAVRRIASGAQPQDLHILFVAMPGSHPRLLAAAHGRPVLTVCDGAADPRLPARTRPAAGCMVRFVAGAPASPGPRFRLDRQELAGSRLRVSARLMTLARRMAEAA